MDADSEDIETGNEEPIPARAPVFRSSRLFAGARLLLDLAAVAALLLFAFAPRSTPPPTGNLTPDQLKAELQSQLADLHAGMEQLKVRPDALPAQVKEGLEKIKSDTDALGKSAQQLQADFKVMSSTAGTFQNLAADLKADLGGISKSQADLAKRLEALEKRQPAAQAQFEPRDVLLVGLNSHNLPISRYLDVFKTVLLDEDLLSAGQPNHRVGFSLVTGENCSDLFPLVGGNRKEGEEKFHRITSPGQGITDRMDNPTLAPKLRLQLKDPTRQPRCVIVASTKCLPPIKDQLSLWDGLTVQVILIGSEEPLWDQEGEKLKGWQSFCDHCGGGLHVLRPGDKGAEPRTHDRLARLLRDYLSPIPSLKKRT